MQSLIALLIGVALVIALVLGVRITFKLFASLASYLPPGAVNNAVAVEVNAGATAHQVLDKFAVPRAQAHLVLVNGIYLAQDARDAPLQSGDTLAVWPPVAGG